MPRLAREAQFWDRAARKYAAHAIGDMPGYERTLARAAELLSADDEVIEFGCGTGTTALRLAPRVGRLVATDLSAGMIEIAREKAAAAGYAHVRFEVQASESIVQPDASFDAALAFNVLHLVHDRSVVLANIRRLLRPGGLFLSKTPCLAEMNLLIRLGVPVAQWLGKAPHVTFFNAAQLEDEIAQAGFEIVERARHGSGKKDPRIFLVARRV